MTNTQKNAGLPRRIASLVYDIFLVGAIWFAVAGLTVLINKGEALPVLVLQFVLAPLLIGSTFLFYYWFWTHGGQTLGMRAWRLKVVSDQNESSRVPDLKQCAIRFFTAFFSCGLGLLFCLFDKHNNSLQCKLSRTKVIVVEKGKPF